MKISYAMVFVSDMSQSVAFYRDIIGLALRFESPQWTEFATEGTTLALHKADEINHPQTGENRPGVCRPGFSVENLADFHLRMLRAEVHCVQPPRDVFGAQIAQYADPDGLIISVSESRNAS